MSGRNKNKKKPAAATSTPAAAATAANKSSSSSATDARAAINTYFDNIINAVNKRRSQLLESASTTSSFEGDDHGAVIAQLGRLTALPPAPTTPTPSPHSHHHHHAHSHGHGHDDEEDDACHGHSHGHGGHGHNHGGGDEHGHSHGGHHSHGHSHGGHDDDDDACHGHGDHGHSHGHGHGDGHGHSHGGPPAEKGPLARAVIIKPVPIYGGRVEVRESKDKGKYWIAKEAIAAGTKLFDESPSLLTAPYPAGYSTPTDVKDALSRCLLQHPPLRASLYAPDDLKDYPSNGSPDVSLATDEEWRRAGAQVQINGFNVNIGDGTCRCFVYDTMSAINHSCWPNADKIDDVNGPAAVWTIRDIAAGILTCSPPDLISYQSLQPNGWRIGEEICISYSNDMLRQPRASRQSYLSRMWRFTCTCDRCNATSDMVNTPAASSYTSPTQRTQWTQLRTIESLLLAGDTRATDGDRRQLDALALSCRHLSPADAKTVTDQCRTFIQRRVFAVTHWRIQPMMLSLIDQLPQTHEYRPFALWLLSEMASAWKLTLPRLSTAHMELIRLADVWHDELHEALLFLQPHYDHQWTQKLLSMYSTLGDGVPHAM